MNRTFHYILNYLAAVGAGDEATKINSRVSKSGARIFTISNLKHQRALDVRLKWNDWHRDEELVAALIIDQIQEKLYSPMPAVITFDDQEVLSN